MNRNRYHVTTLQQVFKRIKPKWSKIVTFEGNRIVGGPKITEARIKALFKDIKACMESHHWKHTKKLDFNLSESVYPDYNVSDKGLAVLGNGISKNFSKLTRFKMHISTYDILIVKISKHLNSLKELKITSSRATEDHENGSKHYRFYLDRLTWVSQSSKDKDLKAIGSEIKQSFIVRKRFTLQRAGWDGDGVTDEGIIGLLNGISRLKKITDQSAGILSSKIKLYLKNLQVLYLRFSACKSITDQSLKELGTNLSRSNAKLKHLDLTTQFCENVASNGLIILSRSLSSHQDTLERLSLDFQGCPSIDDEALKLFKTKANSPFLWLTHIDFNFYNCQQISDINLPVLGNTIKDRFPNLEVLGLNFAFCEKITDTGVNGLVSALNGHLERLQQLILDFSYCNHITDKSLESLSTGFEQHFKKLLILCLDFHNCGEITDAGLQILFRRIPQKLQRLTVKLSSRNSVITDAGFETIGYEISNRLANLEQLNLYFASCDKYFSDKGLEVLIQGISALSSSLKNLSLSFIFCPDITDTGLRALGREISRELTNLQSFSLIIKGCNKITNKVKDRLTTILQSIPKLSLKINEINF